MSETRTYLACPEYVIRLENEQGRLFVHLDVYKWSKAIYLELMEEFVELKLKAMEAGYSHVYTYTRNPRFVRMFGGSLVMKFRDLEVYAWELK